MIEAWFLTNCLVWPGYKDFVQVVKDWAKLEWGDDTEVRFNPIKRTVIVKNEFMEKVFTK